MALSGRLPHRGRPILFGNDRCVYTTWFSGNLVVGGQYLLNLGCFPWLGYVFSLHLCMEKDYEAALDRIKVLEKRLNFRLFVVLLEVIVLGILAVVDLLV